MREWHRLTFLRGELRTLVAARLALLRAGTDPVVPMVRRLLALRRIGDVGAWIYTTEFFAWPRAVRASAVPEHIRVHAGDLWSQANACALLRAFTP